jgi:hemin uptake protein HemP
MIVVKIFPGLASGPKPFGKGAAKVMNSHSHDDFHHRFRRAQVEAPRQVEPMHRPTRVVASSALFSGEHEIGISHAGSLYRLKITRQGKLILNK